MLGINVCRRAAALACLLAIAPFADAAQPAPLTKAAQTSRDFLASNRDLSVHPGDDFFAYANGGWLKRNPIPPAESTWGVDTLVRDQLFASLRRLNEQAAASGFAPEGSDLQRIGDFWRTAMDVEKAKRVGIDPLKPYLARIDAARDRDEALNAAFEMQSALIEVLFGFSVDQDEKNSQVNSVHLVQGGLGLPNRDFYLSNEASIRKIRDAYRKHIARMLQLLGHSSDLAANGAANVLAFESNLASASRKLEDTRDPLANYNAMTPADLRRAHTPSIDWVSRLAAWKLRPDYVVVGQPEFFDALDRHLAQVPLSALKDYLRFHLVSEFAEALGSEIDAEHFAFYGRLLAGQKEQRPRWKRVLGVEQAGFGLPNPVGMIVGRQFVADQFPQTAKQRYARIVEAMRDAYRDRIKQLDWMSEATKAKALEKLAAVVPKVGYPDRWPDYSSLHIGRHSYGENMLNIGRWRFDYMIAKVGKPVDRTEWGMTPQTYNAYYNPSNNEIVLPAAIFTIPGVADADVDDAIAYGYSAASTVGHEITHGFDDGGRKFDGLGNLNDWWGTQDAAQFDQRAAALVAQFDAYEPLPGFRINGKASLGENIADLGGLVIGLDAFKKTEQYRRGETIAGLTPIQRYFLAYAYSWMTQQREELTRRRLLSDFHAPAKWRVLGPLSNIQDFYDAFEVKPSQKMWRSPEDRAAVW